jgi:hypothetical protein
MCCGSVRYSAVRCGAAQCSAVQWWPTLFGCLVKVGVRWYSTAVVPLGLERETPWWCV